MPSLDVPAVRREFRRLDLTSGAWRMDRPPTREDIHARWHWQTERVLLEQGRDPVKADVGRSSSLISGRGHGRPWLDETPLERRFRYEPMPLPWFDNAPARAVLREPDPEHTLLEFLSAGHLAGYRGRPSGAALFRMLAEGTVDRKERSWLAELLCDLRIEDYPQLRRQEALSIRHIARATLECRVRRGALSWWLNQYAARPDGWPYGASTYPRNAGTRSGDGQ